MNTVGIYLKKEREANNISLREVARLTKISPIYLEYIEKNEFEKIPQGPYIKGYIGSYSSAIGCDVDKLIRLYESENRKLTQAEAIQPASASIEGGKHSADKPQKKRPKQPGSLRLSNLGSWFNTLVSFVVVKAASFKAAKKPIDSIGSSKQDMGVPSRHNVLRVKQSGFVGTIHRRSTNRKIWLYSFIAIMGACILILAGVGFYRLILNDPDSFNNAEAIKSPDKVENALPSIGLQPSIVISQSADESATVEIPEIHVNKNLLSKPPKPGAARSGTRKKAEIESVTSSPAIQANALSSDASSTTKQDALRDTAEKKKHAVQSDMRSLTSDPSPKPNIVEVSLKVSNATICRAIENRMPVGVDRLFHPSAGKIYVWTEIEAKQVPSKIHHIYFFGGKKISDVSLDVRSTHWRTWSSKTIANHRYRGEWRVDITTSDGNILRQLYFEVK
jgi:transcriptional regulator with XRE-family HTH domain